MNLQEYNLCLCPLFRGLSNEEIDLLFLQINFQLKTYKKDSLIALNGDECNNLLLVIKGSAKGEMMDFTGKTIKIEDIESPRPLAPAFLFGKNNKFPVTIVANTDTVIIRIPKYSVIKLLQLNEVFLHNFMNQVSNRAQFLSNKIKFLSFQSIKGKIAHYLLHLSNNKTNTIILDKSQNELAEFFGVTRPSLGRAIRDLHNNKIINAKGKNIQIINRNELSKHLS